MQRTEITPVAGGVLNHLEGARIAQNMPSLGPRSQPWTDGGQHPTVAESACTLIRHSPNLHGPAANPRRNRSAIPH